MNDITNSMLFHKAQTEIFKRILLSKNFESPVARPREIITIDARTLQVTSRRNFRQKTSTPKVKIGQRGRKPLVANDILATPTTTYVTGPSKAKKQKFRHREVQDAPEIGCEIPPTYTSTPVTIEPSYAVVVKKGPAVKIQPEEAVTPAIEEAKFNETKNTSLDDSKIKKPAKVPKQKSAKRKRESSKVSSPESELDEDYVENSNKSKNDYVTPRRSFSKPQDKKTGSLRRGRSKKVIKPIAYLHEEKPELKFSEMTQCDFMGLFGMKRVAAVA
jgi:hypothetical protein